MASYARAAGSTCAQLTRRLLYSQETRLQQLGAQTSRQTRGFASGGHGEGVTFEGLTIQKPATWQVATGKAIGAFMWFWLFYRAYHDGETLLFGHASHFEHELEHEKEGGDHH